MKLYTEKQLEKKIEEHMMRVQEHNWTVEHFDRIDKKVYMLEDKVDRLEKMLKVEYVAVQAGTVEVSA